MKLPFSSSPAVAGRGSKVLFQRWVPRQWLRGMTIGIVITLPIALCLASDSGTIHGFVKYSGEAPPRNMFANASDHDCPHGIPQTHLLVKQDTLAIQNVLIVLERDDRRVMPTRLQSTLTTQGCQLLPRIQWLPLGTSLLLVNKDGAQHHLRAWKENNTLFEADLTPQSPMLRRPLVVPGLYKINCDKHLWERAWIYVSPHDSVAVSDAQGEFTIKRVPAGKYKIHAWHEGWVEKANDRDGRLEFQAMRESQAVKVKEDQETEVQFKDLTPSFAVSSPN
jgi:hypothetical protein